MKVSNVNNNLNFKAQVKLDKFYDDYFFRNIKNEINK